MANRKNEARLQNLIRRIVREELKRAKEAEKPLGFSDFDEQFIPEEKNFQAPSPERYSKGEEPPSWAYFGPPQPELEQNPERDRGRRGQRPPHSSEWSEFEPQDTESAFDPPPFMPYPPEKNRG